MKLILISSVFLISVIVLHSQEENDTNERLNRFEKRLRKLSRRLKQQTQQLKDEVIDEVKRNISNDKAMEETQDNINLRQDFNILKHAFHQLNNEINVVKAKLEEAETANELMQEKIETMEKRFSNLSENVEDSIQEGVSHLAHMNSTLTNMSDYQETFENRLLNISTSADVMETSLLAKMDEAADLNAEAQRNISTELNQRMEELYLHVNKSILTTVNNLRREAIKTLQQQVTPTIFQSSDTCGGTLSSEGDACRVESLEDGPAQDSFLVLHTYNETTSSNIFTVVNLRNSSRIVMNITHRHASYKHLSAEEYVYDSFSSRLFWVASLMVLEVRQDYSRRSGKYVILYTKAYVQQSRSIYITKKVNGTIETNEFISVEGSVSAMAVDSVKGMLFYIERDALKYIKTNGEDGRVLLPTFKSSYLTIDSLLGLLFYAEKDRIVSLGFRDMLRLDKFGDVYETRIDRDIKVRYERPVLVTPEKFSTCVYDSVSETLYYDQGKNIMRISKLKKMPTFVTTVPYLKWKLEHYFNNKLYVSVIQGNTARCDVFDLQQATFMNLT